MPYIEVNQDEPLTEESWLNLLVNQRFKIAENAVTGMHDIWDECYSLYRFYADYDAEYWYRSQYFFPEVFAMIESMSPDIIEACIGGEDFYGVAPAMDIGQLPQAKRMDQLMKYQQNEKMDFWIEAFHWIRTSLKYGNGLMKMWWHRHQTTRNYRQKVPWFTAFMTGKMYEQKTQQYYDYDDPKTALVDYKMFFPDPFGHDLNSCKYVFERKIVDFDHLRQGEKEGFYENVDAVKDTAFQGNFPNMERLQSIGIDTGYGQHTAEAKRQFVELLEYWEDDKFALIANRKVFLKKPQANPFWHGMKPYAMLVDHPQEKEFWGIGEIRPTKDSQLMFNDSRNLRLDRFNQMVNQMFVGERGNNIDADQLIWRPSGVIWSDDRGALIPVKVDTMPEAIQTTDEQRGDLERYSGTWNTTRGQFPERKETATGIVKLESRALKRFGLKIKIMRKTGIKRILELQMKLNQQFLPEKREYLMRLFREGAYDFQSVTPEDVEGEFGIVIEDPEELVGSKERFLAFHDRVSGREIWQDPRLLFELEKKFVDAMDIKGAEKMKKILDEMAAERGAQTGEGRTISGQTAPGPAQILGPNGQPTATGGQPAGAGAMTPTGAMQPTGAPAGPDIGRMIKETLAKGMSQGTT
jgi:hypothetical protein